jgi:hypothetical protein
MWKSGAITTGFDSYTTPSQQVHNNPSHEDRSQCVGPTLIWRVVVQLLCWCCKSNIFQIQHIATNTTYFSEVQTWNYVDIDNHIYIYTHTPFSFLFLILRFCPFVLKLTGSTLPSPAKDFGWHDPGYIHSAVMTGLEPSSTFSYRYGRF